MIADEIAAELDKLRVTSLAPGRVAVALKLARALDEIADGDAPTSQAVIADKLDTIMAKLRALAPPATEGDVLDDLADRRAQRRGA
ncbi:hypothetical protein CP967_08605 [Streptomyces nitrosporeus]|uniref:Uncharacterized protein n=1 Tax=Streptomyces nitrosporeus TaxID=28894 RepID=A0A5J6F773_9ACTN|nr:hypothetical protein [Streptomyces nitrosporeus]QEU72022.1 hypothetical protein CP967_08605 [Streptomyces nitrosporeus]GGY81210.1 hypothetical protein GCM10010327_09800 [Streptomyces nitrosporeus]